MEDFVTADGYLVSIGDLVYCILEVDDLKMCTISAVVVQIGDTDVEVDSPGMTGKFPKGSVYRKADLANNVMALEVLEKAKNRFKSKQFGVKAYSTEE